jgi:hypothetical protein
MNNWWFDFFEIFKHLKVFLIQNVMSTQHRWDFFYFYGEYVGLVIKKLFTILHKMKLGIWCFKKTNISSSFSFSFKN